MWRWFRTIAITVSLMVLLIALASMVGTQRDIPPIDVTVRDGADKRLLTLDTQTAITLDVKLPPRRPSDMFSPDGRYHVKTIINDDKDNLYLINNQTNSQRYLGQLGQFQSLHWSPDNQHLTIIFSRITNDGHGEIKQHRYRLADARRIDAITIEDSLPVTNVEMSGSLEYMDLSPNRRYLTLYAPIANPNNPFGREFRVYDLQTQQQLTSVNKSTWLPVWSPDSQWLATIGVDGNQESYWVVHNVVTQEEIKIHDIHPTNQSPLLWSPDSRYMIAYQRHGKGDDIHSELVVVNTQTGEQQSVISLAGEAYTFSTRWTDDSQHFGTIVQDEIADERNIYIGHANGAVYNLSGVIDLPEFIHWDVAAEGRYVAYAIRRTLYIYDSLTNTTKEYSLHQTAIQLDWLNVAPSSR